MIDLSNKIANLEREIKLYTRKAKSAYLLHTQVKYETLVTAKKKHLKDLKQINSKLLANT